VDEDRTGQDRTEEERRGEEKEVVEERGEGEEERFANPGRFFGRVGRFLGERRLRRVSRSAVLRASGLSAWRWRGGDDGGRSTTENNCIVEHHARVEQGRKFPVTVTVT